MRGLVVGRFQPLHKGHEALIRQAQAACDEVVVGIGSSQEGHTARNPFTADEREAMLDAVFPGLPRRLVPDLNDPPNWVAHIQRIVGDFDVVYGNDDATMRLFDDAGIRTVRPGLVERTFWEAATLRALMAAGDDAWMDAVPEAVASRLRSIKGPERLQGLLHAGHGTP